MTKTQFIKRAEEYNCHRVVSDDETATAVFAKGHQTVVVQANASKGFTMGGQFVIGTLQDLAHFNEVFSSGSCLFQEAHDLR